MYFRGNLEDGMSEDLPEYYTVKLLKPQLNICTFTQTTHPTLRFTQTIYVQRTLRASQIRNALTHTYDVTVKNRIIFVLYSHNFSN